MSTLAERAMKRFAGLKPRPQPPLIRTRYPVMMMHGFGLLASLRKGGHLHEEAMNLRTHGVLAYAPNVLPYHTVSTRVGMWEQHLQFILEETGAEKVSLIAHSMGGLDARYLVSERGWHERVSAVVTVATPHHGSSIATVVQKQPDLVRTRLTALVDWMGANAMDDASADFEQAILELTPDYVTDVFNPSVPDHPDVRYWSFAGAAGKGTDRPINPFLVPLNKVLYGYEGVNDGFVSETSARWGTFLGTLEADHTQQVGLEYTPRSTFHAAAFYRGVVQMLADEGF